MLLALLYGNLNYVQIIKNKAKQPPPPKKKNKKKNPKPKKNNNNKTTKDLFKATRMAVVQICINYNKYKLRQTKGYAKINSSGRSVRHEITLKRNLQLSSSDLALSILKCKVRTTLSVLKCKVRTTLSVLKCKVRTTLSVLKCKVRTTLSVLKCKVRTTLSVLKCKVRTTLSVLKCKIRTTSGRSTMPTAG